MAYIQKHNELPLDWPFCTFSDHGFKGMLANGQWVRGEGDCFEPASWAIQLDYDDLNSHTALLCSSHFIQLPTKSDGSMYRMFRLTVRNYTRFLKEKKEN